MVDPDSHGAGYNSPKGSWELPTGSNAQTGAYWREQDQARSSGSSGNASHSGVQGLDFSSSSRNSSQGRILGAAIAIESAIIALTFFGKKVYLAEFFGPNGLKLMLICAVTFAIYGLSLSKIPLLRWVTLCGFSSIVFIKFIYIEPRDSTWEWLGYIFIGLMILDRLFIAAMSDRNPNFTKIIIRLALSVGAPAILCTPSSLNTMTNIFGIADNNFGLTISSQLKNLGYGIARVPIAYYTFDAAHNQYAFFGGNLPTGSVIKIYKVTHAGAFACINHNSAFIDTPDLLKPYSGSGDVSGLNITRNYTDESCQKVIPQRLDD